MERKTAYINNREEIGVNSRKTSVNNREENNSCKQKEETCTTVKKK